MTNHIPGVVMEELQTGEEPVGFHSQGTDVNFPAFEAAIINAVAWANEVPPEILTLAFSNNYSASQAAINEFKIYLNKFWNKWGETFCTPIYIEWLVSEALLGKFSAKGFLESWGDPMQYDVFGAWTRVDWYGSIKPSTDTLKQARGAQVMVQHGWSTNSREARMLTGTKFAQNVLWLKKENEAIARALTPLLELQVKYGVPIQELQAIMGGVPTAEHTFDD
jgi:capsid protein